MTNIGTNIVTYIGEIIVTNKGTNIECAHHIVKEAKSFGRSREGWMVCTFVPHIFKII